MQTWPLTAFEEYMLCDDRPEYPMTGIFRVKLTGRLDRNAFQSAVDAVVARHCLMRCTVIPRCAGAPPVWVDTPGWQAPIAWNTPCNPSGFPEMSFMDLTRFPGVRFWVIEKHHSTDIIIQAHHACTDAIGMGRVLEELLILYAHHRSENNSMPEIGEIDPDRFALRGSHGSPPEITPGLVDHLLGTWEFFSRRPVPVMSKMVVPVQSRTLEVSPSLLTMTLDRELTRKYFLSAKKRGVTVNELLLRDCFLTLADLKKEHGSHSEKDWIRFSIPINLRTRADEKLAMANCVSMVFSEQRMADMKDPARLLKIIHDDIVIKSQSMLKSTFLDAVDLVRRVPKLLTWITRTIPCFSTGVFSNTGLVLNTTPLPRKNEKIIAGNVTVQSIEAFPPIRYGTQLAVCVNTYNTRLSVNLTTDPRYFSPGRSRRFLEKMRSQIQMSIINGAAGET